MKRILFLISLVALVWSCSSDSEGEPSDNSNNPPSNETKEYIVSLGMIGEILDIEESPLTKAIGKDLYGVNVYSKTEKSSYLPYAYGVFSDKSLMKIKLLDGYTYKFEVRMIKDVVNYQGGNVNYPYFNKHFYLETMAYVRESNAFTYSDKYIYNISQRIDRTSSSPEDYGDDLRDKSYYGRLEDYTPIEDGSISINMKIAYFGIKFIAEDLSEGHLSINMKDLSTLRLDANSGDTTTQNIFNFKSFAGAVNDHYSEDIYTIVTWIKKDGASVPLVKKDITFKRNVLTTITIKVKDTSINNGIDISQETGEMIKGDDITLESGTGLDNNVDPSK